ncbi:MAG: hypothetical protein K2Q18_19410 [Bdellovibrionales bacterium]|nr:hypothetical protein [Bdellovibrionales bacterium]
MSNNYQSKLHWVSHHVLEPKILNWFATFESNPVFPWALENIDDNNVIIDLILVGKPLDQLASLNLKKFKNKKIRLWVLCHAFAFALSKTLKIDKSFIGVVPRYEIIPVKKRLKKIPNLVKPWTMVYSGRISYAKNISLFLEVAAHLQITRKLPVKIKIFGGFEYDHKAGKKILSPDALKILKNIDSKPWFSKPEIIFNLGPGEWVNSKIRNPVLFQFSTNAAEDYGVSVAEAESFGWPLVLSEWSCHKDVSSRSSLLVKLPKVLSKSNNKSVVSNIEVKLKNFKSKTFSKKLRPVKKADEISYEQLIQIKNMAIKLQGTEVGFKKWSSHL